MMTTVATSIILVTLGLGQGEYCDGTYPYRNGSACCNLESGDILAECQRQWGQNYQCETTGNGSDPAGAVFEGTIGSSGYPESGAGVFESMTGNLNQLVLCLPGGNLDGVLTAQTCGTECCDLECCPATQGGGGTWHEPGAGEEFDPHWDPSGSGCSEGWEGIYCTQACPDPS